MKIKEEAAVVKETEPEVSFKTKNSAPIPSLILKSLLHHLYKKFLYIFIY